jgi:hypothetical protein
MPAVAAGRTPSWLSMNMARRPGSAVRQGLVSVILAQ